MLVGRVGGGALLLLTCAMPFACGERAGDPVVALAGGQNLVGSAGAVGFDPDPGSSPDRGPIGLCGPCTTSTDCGDANDACIRHQDQGYCGRDCDDERGCPDGYDCVELNDDRLRQCVPRAGCHDPEPAPTLADARRRLLAGINDERAAHDRPPLDGSACLDDLAQASAVEFARTDEPLGKYVKECDPIWPSCVCGWSAEAEIAVSAYDLDWATAVDHVVEAHATDDDTRFVRAVLADDVTLVGIGFWLSADEVWIALSFG